MIIAEFTVAEADVDRLRGALTDGTVTSVELVARYVNRIGHYDRSGIALNSVPVLNSSAFADARASDVRRARGQTLGPLDGIPFTAKASYKVRGLPVTAGSPAFASLVADDDAFAVAQLRAAGAICLGLTNMPPMAAGGMQRGLYGRAESPYSANYLSSAFGSGSSNGSGTATAASFAAFGLAEETWSSGRAPASNNALVAYTLAFFVTGTIVQEFARGTRARRSMYGEAPTAALFRLIARNRRRYGGYIVHLGMLVYFVAFAGMAFKVQREATLKPGESVELKSPFGHTYTFTHVGISQFKQFNRYVSAATIEVARDGVPDGRIVSEKRQHFTVNELGTEEASFEPSTEVGIRSGLQEDIYIVFAGAVNGTEEAVYRFNINPLVWWVWAGGFILAFGGLITMWPGGTTPAASRRSAQAGYGVELAGAGAER